MQDELSLDNFFEGRPKRLHQSRRQIPNEADGIRKKDPAARRQCDVADGRVQSRKHSGVGGDLGPGQPVEERRFSGIGISGQRHRGQGNRLPLSSLNSPAAADGFEILFEGLDAPGDLAPVGFELRFTGSAGSDAASQPGHRGTAPGKAGKQVIELRQLHLQLPFSSSGPASEDIENQLGPVDHPAIEMALQIAKLSRGQLDVEDDQRSGVEADETFQFRNLPRSDESGGIGGFPRLENLGGYFRTRAGGKY